MMNNADSAIRTKASLCTGTGALDRATPGELKWYAETEAGPAKLRLSDYPQATNMGDITTLCGSVMPHVDLLTSGDPCQSLSIAGRKKAANDERFLWPYVIDIIRMVRPRFIFLENVQNIVSVALDDNRADWKAFRGAVLRMRLEDLRNAGYAVKWMVLGACAVGAPHHRHRWFLRAEYVGANAPLARQIKTKCGAPRTGGRILLPTPKATDDKGPGTDRMKRGEKPWYDLPTYVALLPTPTVRDSDGRGEGSAEFWEARRDAGRSNGMPLGAAAQLLSGQWGRYAEAIALWEQITGIPAPAPTERAPKGGRRLNPALSEWMMGYPPGFLTDRLDRVEALKAAGNGVVARQGRAAWDLLELDEINDKMHGSMA